MRPSTAEDFAHYWSLCVHYGHGVMPEDLDHGLSLSENEEDYEMEPGEEDDYSFFDDGLTDEDMAQLSNPDYSDVA